MLSFPLLRIRYIIRAKVYIFHFACFYQFNSELRFTCSWLKSLLCKISDFLNELIEKARRMVPSLSRGVSVVYFLRLCNHSIYVGCSKDLEQRLRDHHNRSACKTTRQYPLVDLLKVETYPNFSSARKREFQLKKWSRAKKEALVAGDLEKLKALSKSRQE